MLLTYAVVPAFLLASAAAVAIPTEAGPGSIRLLGRRTNGQRELYKRADGSFDLSFLKAESTSVRNKYQQHVNNVHAMAVSLESLLAAVPLPLKKRASGNVALTDDIQQGQDIEYTGPFSIGTPSQDLWVPVKKIAGSAGYLHTASDSTYKNTATPFSIQYGSGAVSGTLASDTVSIGGLSVASQYFGAVTTESSQFNGDPAAGILGLAFSSIAETNKPTIIENLISAGKLTSKWEVQANAPVVGGKAVGTAFNAAIDTGTTLIYVPTAVAKAIYAAIPGSAVDTSDSGGGSTFYRYPCSSTTTVALTFAGSSNTYAINAADFNLGTYSGSNCVGGIVGMDVQDANGNNFAIVGEQAARNLCDVGRD
ncbi:hypothetical protein RQP46_006922 [Phenoliferia psychrophenolica]